jgi:hypothetical protein
MVEHVLSMGEALGLIPNTTKKQKTPLKNVYILTPSITQLIP